MKTIEEINEIAPYHPLEWQQGYGIWQSGYMEGQKNGATEQKAIDDEERDTAVYNLLMLKLDDEKKLWLDKACKAFCKARCPLQYEMCENGQWKKDCLAFFCFKTAMEE